MKFVKDTTNRGFKILHFFDDNEEVCDIQQSSADEPHIWVGPHFPNPQILASKIDSNKTGWIKYNIPEDVLITHRMHLNRKQSLEVGIKLILFGLFNRL